MSLNRSVWSGFLLSMAVASACFMSSASAQNEAAPAASEPAAAPPAEAPAAPAAPAAATPGDEAQLAEDFLHYTRVNSEELAKGVGEKLLSLNLDDQKFLVAFETGAGGRDFRAIVEGATRRDALKEVATKVLAKLDAGYRASIRNHDRILVEIDRLGNGVRAYSIAKERLTAAGQYAVPVLIGELQKGAKKDLHPLILKVMTEIGRPMLPPLLEQLNMSEQANKAALVKVVGDMGYRQALPVLVRLSTDPKATDEVKQAAKEAVMNITKGKGVTASAPELFLSGAQSFYQHAPGYQPVNPEEATNAIWIYRKDIDNVVGVPVPTAIWGYAQAQRYSIQCLLGQPNTPGAISLYIAAGFKRTLDLPAGGKDVLREDAKITDDMIAEAAGPDYLNPVLSAALERSDSPLILRTLQALERTAGISGLVPPGKPAANGRPDIAPIVRAMSYPDRVIRFKAAEILAKINPKDPFTGYYRVVPVLAEAISQTGAPTILLVDPDNEHRLKLKDMLRTSAAAYQVNDGASLATALENGKKAAAFDAILIVNSPEIGKIREIGQNDYRLVNPPVIILAAPNQVAAVKATFTDQKGVGVISTDITDEAAVTSAIKASRVTQGLEIDQTQATAFALSAINTVSTLAVPHQGVYNPTDAQVALTDALRDKRAEIATAAAACLGRFYNAEAQRSIATWALSSDNTDVAIRAADFDALAESARRNKNQLDAGQIDKIVKIVYGEQDAAVRAAASRALGALNVPANQASNLITTQAPQK
jgi:hypothetical protein